MTNPIIQIPNLRPEPVRQIGFDQPEQMAKIAQLLQARGALALEEEKFQGEQSMAKERLKFEKDTATAKQQQLDGLRQQLQAAFQNVGGQGGASQQGSSQGIMAPGAQQGAQPQGQPQGQGGPQGMMGAFSQAIPAMAGADMSPAALIQMLPDLLQQARTQNENDHIADIIRGHGDLSDAKNRQNTVSAIIAAYPERGPAIAQALDAQYRVTPVNQGPGSRTILVDASGHITGAVDGPPGKATALDELIQQRAPALRYSLTNMEQIENSDPQSVNQVASAVAAGKLKFGILDAGRMMEVMKGLGFSSNAKQYANYANNYVEGIVGINRTGRGGQYQIDLFKSTTVPMMNEALDPNALKARQNMREVQLGGFLGQRYGFPDNSDPNATPNAAPAPTPNVGVPQPGNPSGIPNPSDIINSIRAKFGAPATPPSN